MSYKIYEGGFDGSQPLDRFFFYHIPKTGGLSLYMAIQAAGTVLYAMINQSQPDFKPLKTHRFDEQFDYDFKHYDFGFVASHNHFGFHEKFKEDFKFISILRSPEKMEFARLIPINVRRKKRHCRLKGLKRFIQQKKTKTCFSTIC